jgi:hypothetical protein
MSAPRKIVRRLERVQRQLASDEGTRSQGISAALNDPAVRLWLDSWVLPELEHALRWARGEEKA